ncbi:MAG: hypothetical protein ABH821_00845 [archaeon]
MQPNKQPGSFGRPKRKRLPEPEISESVLESMKLQTLEKHYLKRKQIISEAKYAEPATQKQIKQRLEKALGTALKKPNHENLKKIRFLIREARKAINANPHSKEAVELNFIYGRALSEQEKIERKKKKKN